MTRIISTASMDAARAGTAPRTSMLATPDPAARSSSVEPVQVTADRPPVRSMVPGSGTRVIASGEGGVRHPVVYEADRSQRFVRVPDIDQPIAFLLAVYG